MLVEGAPEVVIFHGIFFDIKSALENIPDSKVHVAHMGPTWVLSAPGGPHVGPMNLAIRDTPAA